VHADNARQLLASAEYIEGEIPKLEQQLTVWVEQEDRGELNE
jgi:hypothetical protein